MRRAGFLFLIIAGVLLSSAYFPSGPTDARPSLPVAITPTAFSYLPVVARNWPPRIPTSTPTIGWRGRYFPNRNLTGPPALVRNEPEMRFNWGGASPGPGIPAQDWSARWTQTVDLPAEQYRFYLSADDGVRLSIDGERVINEWHDARAETYYVDMHLAGGAHDVQVDYYQGVGDSYLDLWWDLVDPAQFPDWRGEYFANRDLTGRPKLVRNDPNVDFDWGAGSPGGDVPADGFSARWTRRLLVDNRAAGNYYKFTFEADDGMRFWLDGQLFYDRWSDGPGEADEMVLFLTQGIHDLRVEYYEHGELASIRVRWEMLKGP